ncbi:MAG: lysine-2,3-aminomutase-like protein [Beijerinckiaceae bacterium]
MPFSRPLKSVAALADAGLIAPGATHALKRVTNRYAVSLTPGVAAQIAGGNQAIARQYIPDIRELDSTADESADPIGDHVHAPLPGIVHRYPDRVLLKIVHVCPVYCRFCFRREMVGPQGDGALSGEALENALAYIRAHRTLFEVIITGGDPFMLSARRVRDLMQALSEIPHVRVIRWHTRVPVVDPARITPAFVQALRAPGQSVFVAVHANHASEFSPDAMAACAKLREAGLSLVSQSVLLRGINDSTETLADLMRAFLMAGIKPYYLHHPDLAPGTSHFRLPLDEGLRIVEGLRGHISGLAQPAYVLDLPGGFGKIILTRDTIRALPDGRHELRDRHGKSHIYPPVAAS